MEIVYPDPIQSFRFLIKVDGDETVSAAFTGCSGIRMEVETLQARSGSDLRGVRDYTPVLTRYEPVTLRRGVVGDYDFLDWIFAASAREYTGPSGKDLRRTLEIITLNDLGKPGVIWTLKVRRDVFLSKHTTQRHIDTSSSGGGGHSGGGGGGGGGHSGGGGRH